MVQFMPPDSEAFGNEMIVGIRNTREFGMIISAGLGGTDTELYAERFRKGQAIVAASTELTSGKVFFEMFRKKRSGRAVVRHFQENGIRFPRRLAVTAVTEEDIEHLYGHDVLAGL